MPVDLCPSILCVHVMNKEVILHHLRVDFEDLVIFRVSSE